MDEADTKSDAEPTIDPEIEICDAHHHLWDHPGSRYLLDELHGDAGDGHNVVSTVFVECTSAYRSEGPEALRPVGETDFVEEIAHRSASSSGAEIAAIVGFADLCLGDGVAEVLEAHLAASPRFRGIRHAAGWHPSEGIRNSHTRPPEHLLLDPAFRQGFACLERYDLSFDAWLYHEQLDELIDLARAFPTTSIILDHLGGPLGIDVYAGRRDEVFAAWRRSRWTSAESRRAPSPWEHTTMDARGRRRNLTVAA